MSNVMVVNMGLKSVRCIIFNQKGLRLGSAAIAINTAINDIKVEQDPAEWWDKAVSVMGKAVLEAGMCTIDYITVTASASCLVCVSENGEPLEKAFMISDKRAEEEVGLIREMPEFKEVLQETGMDMSASLMLPKIFWVKRHHRELFDKTAYFFTPNDYLIFHLCGEGITDYLNAMKYHYHAEKKCYPDALLRALEIPESKLPKVTGIGEEAGRIDSKLAKLIGVSESVKIIVTSYDAICSFIGSGVSEEGEASDVSGTVTVFRMLSKNTQGSHSTKVYDVPYLSEKARIVGGSNNLGGGLIEWVKQCYYQKEDSPYEIMEKDARESELGARGLIFLPYLLGERTPLWDDNARGVFFGLERMHTRKDMTRAVFESTGFIDKDIIEAVKETGNEVHSVRISGGLARINLISQIKADILGKDILVLSEFETTASGAAMMVLLGQGVYTSLKEVADRFAIIRMIIRPNEENHKKYEYIYELYKDTYQSLKDLFVRRTQILEKIRSDRQIQIENL